jgi:hypothetical protein
MGLILMASYIREVEAPKAVTDPLLRLYRIGLRVGLLKLREHHLIALKFQAYPLTSTCPTQAWRTSADLALRSDHA